MKTIVFLAVLALAIASIEGRRYYGKRRPVKPVNPQVCPQVGCPFIAIPPGCRRETYYYHNGIRCTGCPEDICRQWPNNLDNTWDNNWQLDGNRWPVNDNQWQRRQNRRNRRQRRRNRQFSDW